MRSMFAPPLSKARLEQLLFSQPSNEEQNAADAGKNQAAAGIGSTAAARRDAGDQGMSAPEHSR